MNKKYLTVRACPDCLCEFNLSSLSALREWLYWIVQLQDEGWVVGKRDIQFCERSTGFDWGVVEVLQYDQITQFTRLPATSSGNIYGSTFPNSPGWTNIVMVHILGAGQCLDGCWLTPVEQIKGVFNVSWRFVREINGLKNKRWKICKRLPAELPVPYFSPRSMYPRGWSW